MRFEKREPGRANPPVEPERDASSRMTQLKKSLVGLSLDEQMAAVSPAHAEPVVQARHEAGLLGGVPNPVPAEPSRAELGSKGDTGARRVAFKSAPDPRPSGPSVVQQEPDAGRESDGGREAAAERLEPSASGVQMQAASTGANPIQQAKALPKKGRHKVKIKINGRLVKLTFTLEESTGDGGKEITGKGKLQLKAGLAFGAGPGVRISKGAEVGAEVKDGKVTSLWGQIEAVFFDSDREDWASIGLDIRSVDVTGATPLVTGSAKVTAIQPISLFKGALQVAPKGGFTVSLKNNELDTFTLEKITARIDAVKDSAGNPIVATIDKFVYKKGDFDLLGGKTGPISLWKDRLSLAFSDITVKDSTDFRAVISGSFAVNRFITVIVSGELSSANNWKPRVKLGANVVVPLMPARMWFQKGGDDDPWVLLDPPPAKFSIYGVPGEMRVKVLAALEFGNTEIALRSNIETGVFELSLDKLDIPEIKAGVGLYGCLYAKGSLSVVLDVGLGWEEVAFAGIRLPVKGSMSPFLEPKLKGDFVLKGSDWGAKLDFGVEIGSGVDLSFKPGLVLKLFGASYPSEPLVEVEKEYKDLFSWGTSFDVEVGPLFGADKSSGEFLHEPSTEGMQKAKTEFEAAKKPGNPNKSLSGGFPGSKDGGELVSSLQHIKNTAEIIHTLLAYVGVINDMLGFKISDPPRWSDVEQIFDRNIDFNVLVTRIMEFYDACDKAKASGTLDWLKAKLPGHWKVIPAIIETYLDTVNAGTETVTKVAKFFGVKTPDDVIREGQENAKKFRKEQRLWKRYKAQERAKGIEWVWADNIARLRVIEEGYSADVSRFTAQFSAIHGLLRATDWEDAEAKALAQKDEAKVLAAERQTLLVEQGLTLEKVEPIIKAYQDYWESPDAYLRANGTVIANERKQKVERYWDGMETAALADLQNNPLQGRKPRDLIEACGNDWETVKKTHLKQTAVMQALVDYRKGHVKSIIREMKATPQFIEIEAKAVGSEALTSDYDVTFYGRGAIQAVPTFNAIFRDGRKWGKESGTVFDTNVYAENFLHRTEPTDKGEQTLPVNDPDAQQYDNFFQDVASLTKVRRHMDADTWLIHKEAVLGGISDDDVYAETAKRYDMADKLHGDYINAMYAKILADNPGIADKYPGYTPEELVLELSHADVGMAASNRIYEQKLQEVQKEINKRDNIVGTMEDSPQKDKLIAEYNATIRQLHSEALMFANEAYHAGGTIRHVVGNLQEEWKLDLTASEYFQSMNENYGDARKDFTKYGGKPFGYAAYRSSKYVYRLMDAIKNLSAKAPELVTLEGDSARVLELHEKSYRLLHIRQGWVLDGKDYEVVGEDEKRADAVEFAKPFETIAAIAVLVDKIYLDIVTKARQGQVGT